jgi:transposase
MSLQPHVVGPIPEETVRVAQRAFPKGNPYMVVRAVLGSIYEDEQFVALFPAVGQHAAAPWRLALVTALQYAEGLSDEQAANAVRSRIDWKYVCATRSRTVRVGSRQTLPQVSVPDLSPTLACVTGNGGVRSRG